MTSIQHQRQVAYWRLLTALFGSEKEGASFESMAHQLAEQHDVPPLALNPRVSVDNLLHRYPDLENDFNNCVPSKEQDNGIDE